MKAIYRHKTSGDVFAIETGEAGRIVSTCGPLFADGFDPAKLAKLGLFLWFQKAKLGDKL